MKAQAHKVLSNSSINDDDEPDADFEMGEAPGMFDQKKGYESNMSARKIDLAGPQESHRSMTGNKSIAKTGSIGSMLQPVIDVDEGL